MKVSLPAHLWKLVVGGMCALALLLLLAQQGGIVSASESMAGVLPRAWGLAASAPQAQNGAPTLPPPKFVHVPFTAEPPVLSPAEREHLQKLQASARLQLPAVRTGTTVVHRADSAQTRSSWRILDRTAAEGTSPSVGATSPGSFSFFFNKTLNAVATNSNAALVLSPSATNRGPIIFQTGNWFAARSTDGGQTYSYLNPATAFGNEFSNFGGFSGNQVVAYDVRRDLTFWLLEYADNGSQNLLRLAVSKGADVGTGTWYYYDFVSDTNTRYDFPDLCLSNNYLFLTTMRGSILPGGQANRAFIFRAPLDTLSNALALPTNIYSVQTNSPFRCTRGATSTMYWASHNSTSQVRVYKWPDTATTESGITMNDVNLSAAWSDATRNCGLPWCSRVDGRILGAWVAKGLVGFMWSAAQDTTNGHPYPYLEAVRIKESDLLYYDRPLIADSQAALAFPSVAPNVRGDLGVAFLYGNAQVAPSFLVGIRDDYSGTNWDLTVAQQGQASALNAWGDWTTVRAFAPTGLGWIASGYILPTGCNTDGCALPSFVLFGRHRDERSVLRYWAP